MVSWVTIQSLAIFFGPLLLPRAIAWYRSIRNRPRSQTRPVSAKCSYALGVLFISGVIAFLSTLPAFASPNVFRQTQSRLGTSGGVLLTRLAALRPITPHDEKLRKVFDEGGMDARLLYVQYGPQVIVDCPFASPRDKDAAQKFFFYAFPTILAPHILHLVALGVATSGLLSGKDGARWRTIAAVVGLLLGTAELWFVATYQNSANARSTRLNDIDFVHWKVQVWRGLAIAAVDALLGWVIWLQATGRAFIASLSTADRIAEHGRSLEIMLTRTRGLGVLRNGIVRDGQARNKVNDYWIKESEVMKDVLEEPSVLEAQRNALRRMDSVRAGREADAYLDSVFGPIEST